MTTLGQTGADTITHIVSILALIALGIGVPAVICYFQHAPLTDTQFFWVFVFEIADAIGMSYYSAKFQMTPSGVSVQTDATN